MPNQSRLSGTIYLTKQPVNVACSVSYYVVQKPSNNFLLGPSRNRCPKSNLCRVPSELENSGIFSLKRGIFGSLLFNTGCSIQNFSSSLHIIWHFLVKILPQPFSKKGLKVWNFDKCGKCGTLGTLNKLTFAVYSDDNNIALSVDLCFKL